ncbi:hypothetical protein ABZW47_30840 [Streptomyces sp. NPDC004549]|uniref:hypothetical protein n=1 Tax=Streptomyces sp. NPDC004549 TaxID=3154283 RepID=UPI0033A7812A
MRRLTLPGYPDTFVLTERPTGHHDDDDYEPLPGGLTLDDAVLVASREVQPGDLIVAYFSGRAENGRRLADHVVGPFPAAPHTLRDCPCKGCKECTEVRTWTLADPARVADVSSRYLCLLPADDDGPCVHAYPNEPVAVIHAATVAAAAEEDQADEQPLRKYHVVWAADFEASSPEEAAQLAYEQLKSYATDALPPVLEIRDTDGQTVVLDLMA